jgi:hypothetical protein
MSCSFVAKRLSLRAVVGLLLWRRRGMQSTRFLTGDGLRTLLPVRRTVVVKSFLSIPLSELRQELHQTEQDEVALAQIRIDLSEPERIR